MKPNLTVIQNNNRALAPDPQFVYKLADALNCALQIQSGRQLIYWLGTGEELSNLEALQTWVRSQLLEHGLHPTSQTLAFLMVELEKSLNRWEADQ
ncbi:hypothetical protein [Marinobacter alexandrii]|uniref:hypothetical protein n=1 Tax=Marinobacter alexandrii TaxID=2570351 RepID=UPI00110953A7|nr:hypothetical protein [Marinobacter alexandrii]